MITEDYVSFETAKLLKEKEFDEPTLWFYAGDRTRCLTHKPLIGNWYKRPTLQMAMKWLREVHNLYCDISFDYFLGWYYQITSLKKTVEYDYKEMKIYHTENDNGFSSSEQACEAAIKYCLENLI